MTPNSTEERIALKPCPFCGGRNVKTFGPFGWYRQWGISHSCASFYSGTQDMFQGFHSEAEAIAAWNTRDNEVSGLVEALEEIENESVFNQQRFAEDTDTDYFLRCFKAVKERARAALAKHRQASPVERREGMTGAPSRDGLSSASPMEPQASPPKASIPSAWEFTQGEPPELGAGVRHDQPIWALGRYGDVFGPLPAEMFSEEAWRGCMFHGSHDLIAFAVETGRTWREIFPVASAIEARIGESAPEGDAR